VHRKTMRGSCVYRWALKHKFPKVLQLMCHNCNMARAFYGKCPHKL
jgi:hypothetical protein